MQRSCRRLTWAVVVALSALCISESSAYAYIDPGTGSYLFQILIAGLLGAAFMVRIYWNKLKAWLGVGKAKTEDDDEDEN